MARKNPYFPLYTGDWLKDPSVSLCEPATRGIWIDLLCAMHERDRCGVIVGTRDQIARLGRCSAVSLDHALADLQATKTAEVTERDGKVTVINRRMKGEADKRKRDALRQHQKRLSDQCHTNVALEDDIGLEEREKKDAENFERFWLAFPKGRKQSKGAARDAFFKALRKESAETIIAAATHYATTPAGKGQYVKMPSTWLNQECWDDDRAAWEGTEIDPAEEARRKAEEVREQDRRAAAKQLEEIRKHDEQIKAERVQAKVKTTDDL